MLDVWVFGRLLSMMMMMMMTLASRDHVLLELVGVVGERHVQVEHVLDTIRGRIVRCRLLLTMQLEAACALAPQLVELTAAGGAHVLQAECHMSAGQALGVTHTLACHVVHLERLEVDAAELARQQALVDRLEYLVLEREVGRAHPRRHHGTRVLARRRCCAAAGAGAAAAATACARLARARRRALALVLVTHHD